MKVTNYNNIVLRLDDDISIMNLITLLDMPYDYIIDEKNKVLENLKLTKDNITRETHD